MLIELLKNDLCIARSMLLIELAQKSLREAWNNMQEPVLARDAYKGVAASAPGSGGYTPISPLHWMALWRVGSTKATH